MASGADGPDPDIDLLVVFNDATLASRRTEPETGGSYTVKVYEAVRTTDDDGNVVRSEIRLKPLNPAFDPIIIDASDDEAVQIVAEFVEVLG